MIAFLLVILSTYMQELQVTTGREGSVVYSNEIILYDATNLTTEYHNK